MTCIIAIAEGWRVTMGADSCVIEGWQSNAFAPSLGKIIRFDHMLVAVAGTSRVGQVIRFNFDPPSYEGPAESYLMRAFVPALRSCLAVHGCLKTENGVERAYTDDADAEFVIGIAGRVFLLYPAFDLMENALGYVASGSGADVALGAVFASRLHGDDPRTQIENGLQAAKQFSLHVREPFDIQTIDGDD